jgi:putative hydrolase of the HAD superfamily
MAVPKDRRFHVQSVIFDLFHTLVDPDAYRPEGFVRAYKIAEVLGLADRDAFAGWWGEMEAERHVNGSKRIALYADEYLLENTGHRCSAEQLAEVDRIWGQMHDRALLSPEAGVLAALESLRRRGVKVGLLSNIDEREAAFWTRSPLSSFFDATCLSFEIGHSKPSREAYSAVLSRLGADAASSVYVGDGSHDELRGAREAGFGLVVFMKGFISRSKTRPPSTMKKREDASDATIMGLDELLDLVDELQS